MLKDFNQLILQDVCTSNEQSFVVDFGTGMKYLQKDLLNQF